jgi:hypothetical protein
MSSPFAITAATNTVLLDSNRQGQTSFTVSNTTAHSIRGRAHIVAQQSTAGAWLTLLGETERDFPASGSQQYVVQITVPPGAPSGDYTFRLDVVDLANPDDDFSEGPTIKFVGPAPVPMKKPFPWWMVAVAVGILILVGAGTYGIVQLSHKNPVVTPTTKLSPTPLPPTPTPRPAFSPGQWQGQFTFASSGNKCLLNLSVKTVQNNGAFSGKVSTDDNLGNIISSSVTGTESSIMNQFDPSDQKRLVEVERQFGKGSGTFVVFTSSMLQGPFIGGCAFILRNSSITFDAVVYADGSLHGILYYPNDTQGGPFDLNKTSQASIPTEHPLNLMKALLLSKPVDVCIRNVPAL